MAANLVGVGQVSEPNVRKAAGDAQEQCCSCRQDSVGELLALGDPTGGQLVSTHANLQKQVAYLPCSAL